MGARSLSALPSIKTFTLSQLEARFGHCLPKDLFAPTPAKTNSRKRIYTQSRTFWAFLWQCLTRQTSCREVVRQLQALFVLENGPTISAVDAAYVRARQRLPEAQLKKALEASACAASQRLPASTFLQGRTVQVVDGTTLTLPDSPENRQAFPPVRNVREHCGFPMLRLLVFFALGSGAILTMITGSWYVAEMRLFYQLMGCLQAAHIVLADRGFGKFVILALLRERNVDLIARSGRKNDGRRRLKWLGRGDWLVLWKKGPCPSALLSLGQWDALPEAIRVRIVRGSLYRKGYRVRQLTLVTTLLDPDLYPTQQILEAYLRRWRLEMSLDDLKTTMGMEMLRCQTPDMVNKEVLMHLIGHNLIRTTMVEAAVQHPVALERISFKGTLDALRHFSNAMCQARTKKQRHKLWHCFLEALAADQLPQRPDRREPRAVKRRRKKYDQLDAPRHLYRDRPKRTVRQRLARLKRNRSMQTTS
jgi:hypothetical protein